jgi:dihydrofolate synthase/folylpolyglutamate synthase
MRLISPAADYGAIHLSLAGRHQAQNAVVAVRILELVSGLGVVVTPHHVRAGLAHVRWPGRLERVVLDGGRELLLDAAHNPAGAAALASYLAAAGGKRPLVFAAMRDKNAQGMLSALLPHVSLVVMTKASHPRSADPMHLAQLASAMAPLVDIVIEPAPAQAMVRAWQHDTAIVVAGSIFLLGDVMRELARA